jgi:DNA helicase-2/ATP-dependent DNA helicase PcrA
VLDPEQLAAVRAPRGPVCVLAGAGTGKTRTITHRIAHLVGSGLVAPGQVLAVTFTARAAGELRTRLRTLSVPQALPVRQTASGRDGGGEPGPGLTGVQARTFHAAAIRQLRYFWPRVVGEQPWQLLESKLRAVAQAASGVVAGAAPETLRDLAGEIEWAAATLVAPEDYPAAAGRARRDTPLPADQVAAVYRAYRELKTRAGLLDFDDLLLYVAAALEEHPDVAGEFRDRYRCFLVDEYQDVTPLQQRVLAAWLGGRDDLTVVGDANQTIYSFTGATPRYLLEFTTRYPDATLVRLERDYRSTPQVVGIANRVIGGAGGRAAGARLRLVGQRPAGPAPGIARYDDEPAEAAAVTARIGELVAAGTPAGEIAVLYRVNAQSEAYEQALADAGLPYQVRGGERFFQRAEVRRAMQALRGTPAGADSGDDLPGLVRRVLAPVGLTPQPPPGGSARDRWDSLNALAGLADELAGTLPGAGLAAFVAELSVRAAAQHPPALTGVSLASLHASKGLEWDAVFLVGLAEGTLPIQHADGAAEAIEEERRLLYVGVTRARVHLRLSWAAARSPGGRQRRPSRFLEGLAPGDHPVAGLAAARPHTTRSRATPVPVRERRCRMCGSILRGVTALKLGRCADCPSNVDEGLLDRLQRWRAETARAQRVPEFVVFTDTTLTAIAEQRPGDDGALVSIPGIGAAKLRRYGEQVLAVCAGTDPAPPRPG